MKLKFYSLTILTGALTLAACTNDNVPQAEVETAARFFTNLEKRVQTRMVDDQWAPQDAIGIFTLNDEQKDVLLPDGTAAPSNMRLNMKYTRTDQNDGWESENPFYFKNPIAPFVKFIAYYPWTDDARITDMDVESENLKGTIDVDASDQSSSKQPTFDFLYADKDAPNSEGAPKTPQGDKNNPNVKFQFSHAMTKVVIKLKADDNGSTTLDDVMKLTPTLKSFISRGTFNLADGKVTPAGFTDDEAVKDLVLSNKTEDDGYVSYTAILPPQTTQGNSEQKDPEVVLSGDADNYRSAKILSGKELEAGMCYTVTITVKKMSLVIESSEITNWKPGEEANSDAILQ